MLSPTNDGDGVVLDVKVVPGASKTRVLGVHGDRLRVAVAAPPEKGKANAALAEFLANVLGVRKRDVVVVDGLTSPRKTVRIVGMDRDLAARRFGLIEDA